MLIADGLPTLVSANTISECLLQKYSFLDLPTDVQLERVKNEKFKAMCRDLWPNIYKQMEEKEQNDKCKDLIQNLNRRILDDTVLKNLLENNKPNTCCSGCEKKTECFTKMDAALADTKNSPNINIYINGNEEKKNCSFKSAAYESPKVCVNSQLKMSSYNYPFCTTKYSEMRERQCPKKFTDFLGMKDEPCMSSKDEAILNSIKETQDKLKMSQQIEMTNELVEDLIKKFGVIQTEMKGKVAILKAKSDLQSDWEKIDKEFIARRSRKNLSPCVSPCRSLSRESMRSKSPCFMRSKSPCSSYRSKSREFKHISPCRSVSPVLHCTRELSSCSRDHRPLKSCLKRTKPPGVASISYRLNERRQSTCASSAKASSSKDIFHVAPKVDCWNLKSQVDSKIY